MAGTLTEVRKALGIEWRGIVRRGPAHLRGRIVICRNPAGR